MGMFSKREPRHSSGETKGQDNVRKHGSKDPRRTPGKPCRCGSGVSENVCHHRKVGSGRDRIPTMGKGTTRKWGQR